MSKNQKALSSFARMRDDEFLTQAKIINRCLTGNEYYESPEPGLAVLMGATDDYEVALAESRKKGNPFDTAIKKQARQKLEEVLFDLAFYVNKIAQGDLPTLLSSGFPVSSTQTTYFSPDIIRGMVLSDGRQPGQLRLDFEKQERVLVYEYRYTYEKDSNGELVWNNEVFKTSSSRGNILAVEEGKRYYVQVRAVNIKGISLWSEAVSLMAR